MVPGSQWHGEPLQEVTLSWVTVTDVTRVCVSSQCRAKVLMEVLGHRRRFPAKPNCRALTEGAEPEERRRTPALKG